MSEVLLVGEPLGLFTATEWGLLKEVTTFTKSLAGAEVNVGIGLSRLGKTVDYVTKLGKDPLGEFIFEALQREQLGTDFVTFDDTHTTGFMFKNKVKTGDPDTAYYRKNSAFSMLGVKDVRGISFENISLLHVTGIPPALGEEVYKAIRHLMKKAKEAGTFITFDPNLRPALWSTQTRMIQVLNELASYANVVLPGISEAEILVGSKEVERIKDFYFQKGADIVIVKDGSHGAYVSEKGKETVKVPGFKVEKVVDTVGAGDGFAVGIVSAYLDGLSWEKAAKRANAIGSLQVQQAGDNEGLPTTKELEEYYEE